ncbi:MAG: flagellin [Pseudomonadota bacterium]|nr:flagellin [Pseudomonadota bacterium]
MGKLAGSEEFSGGDLVGRQIGALARGHDCHLRCTAAAEQKREDLDMTTASIITNAEALLALRNLNQTNRELATTQARISTGLKINSAIDDASNFAISQGIRSDIQAISAITQGLNNSKGIGKVALAGATSISDLLADIRSKLTELSNAGVTTAQRDILTDDFNGLMSQVGNFIANSSFNGQNLLTDSATNILTVSNLAGTNLSLAAQDLQTDSETLAAVSVANSTSAQAVLTDEFETLQTAVNSALGALGADIRAMELQTDFLIEISDATEEGLGSIVDADMARESARLTSLQIRQQLGVQVSGIANKSPQALLALFQ